MDQNERVVSDEELKNITGGMTLPVQKASQIAWQRIVKDKKENNEKN